MSIRSFALAAALLAGSAAAAGAAAPVTDAAACATVEGWQAFIAQWTIDLQGALTAQTLTPEVHDYIARRADELAKALPGKPTPADLIGYCEKLNVLFPR